MIVKKVLNKGKKLSFVFLLLLGLFAHNTITAQKKPTTISGWVKDDAGLPIPGVNIIEKGTKNSSSSDFDGKFTLRISGSKSELVFSFIGFETLTQSVGQKTSMNVVLKNAASKLDEVVVIGYGTSRKSDLTGSVATISGADLKKVPMSNVAETLTGRVAGVQVTSSEGSPDSEVKIRVRGGGSLSQDSSPLIIVDGFPVNSMSDISPADVENITILKDASSTAIYGSRGAYGVIIITTKSGSKTGKMSVNYNVFYGAKTIAKDFDVLNPEDFAKWQYEYAMLSSSPKGSTKDYDKYFAPWQSYAGVEGTDWQEEIYGRTGKVQSHDLGIRGGSDKINYNFNYALYDESAIMVGSDFRRNNLSLNLKNKASDKVDLSFTMRYSNTVIGGSGANEQKEVSSADSRLKHVVGYSPIDLPGLTTDDTDEAVASYLVNPFVAIADNDRKQIRNNFNMLGSFSWKIINNLQFKSDFGLDVYDNLDYRFYGRSTYYVNNIPAATNQGKPSLIISDEKNKRFRNANTFNYDFKDILGKNHSLKLLLGEEIIDYQSNKITSTIQGYPKSFTFEDAVNLTTQGIPQSVNNNYLPDDKLLSFFGRVNYDIKNRYLFTATYRADGSSKFLGDNRWGYFPSAAAAWKINEESFMKDVSWVNLLKMRLSYGEAGNNNIPVGQTIRTFESTATAWINNITNFWAPSKTMPNPDLKWETTVTQDLGIDFGFFNNRISGTVDVYKNITKDLLINFPVSGTGYDTQYRNMGENQNEGLEVTLNLVAIQKEDYDLSFNFNIGFNKNNINSLGIMDDFGYSSGWASTSIGNDYLVNVNQPLGLMKGYLNDGRYEVSDFDFAGGVYTLKAGVATNSTIVGPVVPGSMKLKDLTGDGKVDANDITVIGNANPKNTGGLVINANIHQFDFMAAFNWSYGNDAYNANKIEFTTTAASPNGQYRNLISEMEDGKRWTNLDPNTGLLVTDPAQLTALNATTTMWSPKMDRFVFSDWAVEDASFFRLNTFTIGYTAPEKLVSKLGITKLRFYQTMSNVFTATHYSGPDPEVSTRRNTPYTPGVDYSAYPRSRQVVFGLNLSF
ncbi:SusC/RagA family TonB-linked outer membrane protein [Flavobacterium nackdongense]|uniref:TonB-dependent receptor n=1 Tax=Flavobacterium nackdongense TaxID=2547394 RepID=A0A4P6Y962_9FLAO|nr:TonB-dependent receptor [Flavobacterium nackdongense]QBN19521.1 TonB-dependent receptor [Flavobacterium nackdongense]